MEVNRGVMTTSGSFHVIGAGEVGRVESSFSIPGSDSYHTRRVDGVVKTDLGMLKPLRPLTSSSTVAADRGVRWFFRVKVILKIEQDDNGATEDISSSKVPSLLQFPAIELVSGCTTLTANESEELVMVPLNPVIVSAGKHFRRGTFEASTNCKVLSVHGY